MSKNMLLIVGVGIVAVIGIWVYSWATQKRPGAVPEPSPVVVTTSPSPEVVVASPSPVATSQPTGAEKAEVKVVNLEAGAYYFEPSMIKVQKGQRVRIVMKAADMMHDFTIDELGVKLPTVLSGKTGTVEFVADKVGTFEYYCSVNNHRKNGQVGTLVVE